MPARTNDMSLEILQQIEARLPSDATPQDVERVRRDVLKLFQAVATLRAVPLQNSDEPDPMFRAFRGPG